MAARKFLASPLEVKVLGVYLFVFPFFAQLKPARFGVLDITNTLVILAGFIFILRFLQKAPKIRAPDPFLIFLVIFFCLGSISLLQGASVGLYTNLPLKILQLGLLWLIISEHRRHAPYFAKAFILGCFIAALGGLAQFISPSFWEYIDIYYLDNTEKLRTSYVYQNRNASVSFFPPNGNFLGAYMDFATIVMIAYRACFRASAYFTLLILFFIVLVLSASITSFIALNLGLLTLFFHKRIFLKTAIRTSKKHGSLLTKIVFPAVVLSVIGYVLSAGYFSGVTDKLSRYFEPGNYGAPVRGLEARFDFWDIYLTQLARENQWLLGLGLGNVGIVDNTWVLIFVTLGVTGILPLGAAMLAAIWKTFKINSAAGFAVVGMAMFLVLNSTALSITYMPVIVGLGLLLYRPDFEPTQNFKGEGKLPAIPSRS